MLDVIYSIPTSYILMPVSQHLDLPDLNLLAIQYPLVEGHPAKLLIGFFYDIWTHIQQGFDGVVGDA